MSEYSKRLVEVDEILRHLSKSNYNKIPEKIKKAIEEGKNKEYIWEYDNTKKLKDQDVPDDTIAILSYINMEYLLNEEQKEFVKNVHRQNEKKRIQINNDYSAEIFKKRVKKSSCSKQMIVTEKSKNLFEKIVNFIKGVFNKNK